MQFKAISSDDVELLRPFFSGLSTNTCDLTPGVVFMWHGLLNMEYAIEDNVLYTRLRDMEGNRCYFTPLARDLTAALKHLASQEPHPLRFNTVPKELLPYFEAAGLNMQAEDVRRSFDYIYAAEDLSTMRGKRYSGQRNQISQLNRARSDIRFEAITDANLSQVVDFFTNSYTASTGHGDGADVENALVLEILTHLEHYHMFGDTLIADGQVIGFAVGEILGNTLFVHIEKADRNLHGAYQSMVKLFAEKHTGGPVQWVNREDDAGDPGLRTAKLALHPHHMAEKCQVILG
ncbi:MAG: phosphatidylglycerol lysyltransferase domain-containing protein [Oscillospiraceae bacterium]|nr:phosphatidylglycerol lysyltransferase domain-containing protein [Oscillospiraceae bacterium]